MAVKHAALVFSIITTKTKHDIDIDRHKERSTQQTKGIGIDIRKHTQRNITRLEPTKKQNTAAKPRLKMKANNTKALDHECTV